MDSSEPANRGQVCPFRSLTAAHDGGSDAGQEVAADGINDSTKARPFDSAARFEGRSIAHAIQFRLSNSSEVESKAGWP